MSVATNIAAVLVLGGVVAAVTVLTSAGEEGALPDRVQSECGLYAYAAQITEVYDGDTVTADVDLGFNTWRKGEKLRLFGIDTPEMRGDERPQGIIARDALRGRILGKSVTICTIKDKTGKYGRYLAEIYLGDENINEWLLDQGLAAPYPPRVAQSSATASLSALFGRSERFERAALD